MPDVYIDTDVASGGSGTSGDPYSTLTEAWEAEDLNLASGETWNFFCTGTTADNASLLSIDGYASGVTAINIYPWHEDFGASSSPADGWYTGDDNWSASHYRLIGDNNAHIFELDNSSGAATITVEGIQLEHTSNSSGHRCVSVEEQSSGAEVIFRGNRLKISGTGQFPRGIRAGASAAACTLTFVNNLVTYGGTQAFSAFNLNDGDFTPRFINNTVVYSGTGGEDFFDDSGSPASTAYNNVAYAAGGTTDIEFDNSGTLTSDYNASIVSADRGANGFDCATGDFTTYGTGDTDELTPATSQTNAWGAGGITNSDQALIPTTDIRGNARNTAASGNTSIGAFAASGEGAGGTDATATPGAGSATGTGSAPTVAAGATTEPGAGSAAGAGAAPTVAAGATAEPGAGSATGAGTAPTVAAGATAEPGEGTATGEGSAPTVSAGGSVTTSPGAGAASGEGSAPTTQADAASSPSEGTASGAGSAPTVSAGATSAPSAGTATGAGSAPTVTAGSGAEASPGAGSASGAGVAPSISAGSDVDVASGAATGAGIAPAVSNGEVSETPARRIIILGAQDRTIIVAKQTRTITIQAQSRVIAA